MTARRPRLWRSRSYLLWLISDTSKGLAQSLFSFAIPLLALFVTDDPAQAGLIGGVGMAVRLVATLGGGILADRHRRVLLMVLGSALGILLAGAFTLLALANALTFAILLGAECLLAVRSGLFDVAGESALKEIVPAAAMGRAQAANQGRDAALQLAGGPLGGVLLGIGGWLVGAVMTLCHAVAALTAWLLLRTPASVSAATEPLDPAAALGPDPAAAPKARNAAAELREGFAWLFSRPDLRGVLLIVTIVNLGLNSAVTTATYALQQAGDSALTIGAMSSGVGLVMLAGAVIAPFLVPRIGAGSLTVVSLVTTTLGVAAVATVQEPWAIVLVLGVVVLFIPPLNASLMGYFMVATPSALIGRANSAAGVLGMGAMPLAPLIAGFGLTWLGRGTTLLACAGLCGLAAVLALGNRTLRSLPAEAGWAAHAAQHAVAAVR